MRCEGREDFSFLSRRNFSEVEAARQLGSQLVEFLWRDLEVTMLFLKTRVSFTRLGWREFKRPARDLADPKGAHELEARMPVEVLGVPFPERWILRSLSHDRVLHDRVAKMVDDCSDGEGTSQPVIQTFLVLRSSL